MSKSPMRKASDKLKESRRDEPQRNKGTTNPFFKFRFSYKEMSSAGGKTYYKSIDNRFQDGKFFTSEEFEGTTGQEAYTNAVKELHTYWINQTAMFWKQMSMFMPSNKRSK